MRALLGLLLSSLVACGGTVIEDKTSDASVSDSGGTVDTGSPDVGFDQSCSMMGMCALVPKSCCGSCGVATRTDQIAIPRDKQADYRALACSVDGGPVGCPECAGMPDPELQAFCVEGRCQPVFVPSDPVSGCATDADCVLVQGTCCGCDGSERNLVAIARGKEGDFFSQICDPRVDCAPCPPPPTPKSKARCDAATRHCVTDRVL